ncbi:unnamed protein product [marine sediment metagenome]|uniref:Uncharacterized protein n=1 Tax=marine sediment metagenome TaxID=412755 RepID=X0XHJ0_9ZZZZ
MTSDLEMTRRLARYMLEIPKKKLANEICKEMSEGGLERLTRKGRTKYYAAAQAIIVMLRARVEHFGPETQDLYKEDEEVLYPSD